ncbi:MAG: ATP-binding protein [Desulfobacterales bacterium]|nr:ATP-binding protein [Desulfobacterales bacterium]
MAKKPTSEKLEHHKKWFLFKTILKINYLRNILIVSLIIAVGFPICLVLFISPAFISELTKNTENEAHRLAEHLKVMFGIDKIKLTEDFLPSKPLDADIKRILKQFEVTKIKIFSKKGRIIYSTSPKDIGVINQRTYFHDIVAKGKAFTKIVKAQTRSLDGEIVKKDVVETYVPIMQNNVFLGAFEIYYDITERKKSLEMLLLTSLSILIAVAISLMGAVIFVLIQACKNINQREQAEETTRESEEKYRKLYAQSDQQNQSLNALYAISQTVNQSLELEQTLNDTLDKIIDLFKCHSAVIRIQDDQTQEMVCFAQKGLSPEDEKILTKRLKWGEGFVGLAIKAGRVETVEDIHADTRVGDSLAHAKKIGGRSLAVLPLFSQDKVLGSISIRYLEPRIYTGEEIDLFTSIGLQVGTAIGNAKLYQDKTDAIKELEETRSNLQQAQKMESLGTLSGGIAHEFNNILTIIIGNAQLLQDDIAEQDPVRECLDGILYASLRAKDLVQHILSFARKSLTVREAHQISPILQDSLNLLRSTISSDVDIRPNLSCQHDTVLCDTTQINQVLINLCTNAAHAMRESGGILNITLENISLDKKGVAPYEDLTPGDYVKLTVSDTGHGIGPEDIDRIFDPFFTTKEVGEGTGLGLSVIYGIVKSHDGGIKIQSTIGKGTTVEVVFPLMETEPEIEAEESKALPRGNERILVVDDEEYLVKMSERMLQSLGYAVTTRTSSVDALELFRSEPDKFDLVITDMAMPGMAGDRLAQELIKIRPDVSIILCTGYSRRIDENRAKELGIKAYVTKPFIKNDMAETVRDVLDEAK